MFNYCSRKKCGKTECRRNIIHSTFEKDKVVFDKYYDSVDCVLTNKGDKPLIHIKECDIKNAKEKIIAHQVNCIGIMGSGVAKVLRETYPSIFPPYDKYCKLWTHNQLMGKIQILDIGGDRHCCNMFAQRGIGRKRQYTEIECLTNCVFKLHKYAKEHNIKAVAMPFGVGCGRGGADWNEVYEILMNIFVQEDGVELILYKKTEKL